MIEKFIAQLIAFAFAASFFTYVCVSWIRDLQFYKKNGWDFTKDSGRNLYPGRGPPVGAKPIPNKHRVFFAYPFCILVSAVLFVLAGLALFGILT